MASHKDLIVWQKSIGLVTEIYKVTKDFPKHELFGLTNQMQRAAVSIPSNIAEGAGRNSTKEGLHFFSIALGSASELETQIIVSLNIGYISQEQYETLSALVTDILRMLPALIKRVTNDN